MCQRLRRPRCSLSKHCTTSRVSQGSGFGRALGTQCASPPSLLLSLSTPRSAALPYTPRNQTGRLPPFRQRDPPGASAPSSSSASPLPAPSSRCAQQVGHRAACLLDGLTRAALRSGFARHRTPSDCDRGDYSLRLYISVSGCPWARGTSGLAESVGRALGLLLARGSGHL